MANANGLGVRQNYIIATAIAITSNATLASINLGGTGGIPIAASKRAKVRYWIPITVGATGGVRAQIVVPAGGTAFISSIRLNNTVAPSSTIATQAASAAFTNALANAGTHWLEIEVTVTNGLTAGAIDLQIAQNTSDALTLTVVAGGTVEVIFI